MAALVRQLLLASQQRLFSFDQASPTLDQPYPSGFRPLPALGETEGDTFTFIEGREPRLCESRNVDECVLSTTIPSDEAKALVDVEPLHRPGFLDRCVGRWPARCRRSEARSA